MPTNRAGKSALGPVHWEKSGFEIIGGKRIPFVRNQRDKDCWTTTYGAHDPADHSRVRAEKIAGRLKTIHGTTLLVRHERRGQSSWMVVYNGRQSISGKVANKLQGIIDTREGNEIMALVDHLSHSPFAIDDSSDYGRAWALLCTRIQKASDEEFAKIVGDTPSGGACSASSPVTLPGGILDIHKY